MTAIWQHLQDNFGCSKKDFGIGPVASETCSGAMSKLATHLRYLPTFEDLTEKVDEKLHYFADLPDSILALMGRYHRTCLEQAA